jgi:hypothetical protein
MGMLHWGRDGGAIKMAHTGSDWLILVAAAAMGSVLLLAIALIVG